MRIILFSPRVGRQLKNIAADRAKLKDALGAEINGLLKRVISFIRTDLINSGIIYRITEESRGKAGQKLKNALSKSSKPEARFLLDFIDSHRTKSGIYDMFFNFKKDVGNWQLEDKIRSYIEKNLDKVKSDFEKRTPKPEKYIITRKGGRKPALKKKAGAGAKPAAKSGGAKPDISKLIDTGGDMSAVESMSRNEAPKTEMRLPPEFEMIKFLTRLKNRIMSEEENIQEKSRKSIAAGKFYDLKKERKKAIGRILLAEENIPAPVKDLMKSGKTNAIINLIYRNRYGGLNNAEFVQIVIGLLKLEQFKTGRGASPEKPMDAKPVCGEASSPALERPFKPAGNFPEVRIRGVVP